MKVKIDSGVGDIYLGLSTELTLLAGVGRHRCSTTMTIDGSRLPAGTILDIAGEVWLEGSYPSWLGQCWPERPVATQEFEIDPTLAFELSDDALAQLESLRAGGDLSLRYHLNVIVRAQGHGWPISQQLPIRVPAAWWAEQLHNLGTAATLTVVVPAPLSDGARRDIGQHLRAARSAIEHGRYDDAVRHARLALDVVSEISPPPSRKEVTAVPPEQRDPRQRWAALHHDMQSLASAAHHRDGVAASFTWTRGDAVAVVAAITALAARAH
jgi:hypothetical protein